MLEDDHASSRSTRVGETVEALLYSTNRYNRTGITALSSSCRRFSVSKASMRPLPRQSCSASSTVPADHHGEMLQCVADFDVCTLG